MHARAHDSSTQPSFHITFLLRWQTAPQPFVIITEPFQLKDKSCGLSSACCRAWPWDSYTSVGGPWEGRGEPTLAPGISGGHTTFLLLRSKSQEKNLTLNKMTVPSSSLFLHCTQELFWFCPGKCRLPVQRLINCYDLMVYLQSNSSPFHS